MHHGPYELPEHEPQLALPFAAITAAQDTTHPGRLHARSLLAAACAIMVIQRRPADLERTDELLQLQAAVEALCDLPDHEDRPRRARWRAMNEKLGTWRELSGYSTRELQAAEELTRDLRNIAAHGSDQVLLNLGYPAEVLRQLRDVPSRSGSELALARMSAAVPVLRHAVTHVAGELARRAVEQGFDDAWFAGLTR